MKSLILIAIIFSAPVFAKTAFAKNDISEECSTVIGQERLSKELTEWKVKSFKRLFRAWMEIEYLSESVNPTLPIRSFQILRDAVLSMVPSDHSEKYFPIPSNELPWLLIGVPITDVPLIGYEPIPINFASMTAEVFQNDDSLAKHFPLSPTTIKRNILSLCEEIDSAKGGVSEQHPLERRALSVILSELMQELDEWADNSYRKLKYADLQVGDLREYRSIQFQIIRDAVLSITRRARSGNYFPIPSDELPWLLIGVPATDIPLRIYPDGTHRIISFASVTAETFKNDDLLAKHFPFSPVTIWRNVDPLVKKSRILALEYIRANNNSESLYDLFLMWSR